MDIEGKAEEHTLMKEHELLRLLRISRSTFWKLMREGPPKSSKGEGDVRQIQMVKVGGKKLFLRSSVNTFLATQGGI